MPGLKPTLIFGPASITPALLFLNSSNLGAQRPFDQLCLDSNYIHYSILCGGAATLRPSLCEPAERPDLLVTRHIHKHAKGIFYPVRPNLPGTLTEGNRTGFVSMLSSSFCCAPKLHRLVRAIGDAARFFALLGAVFPRTKRGFQSVQTVFTELSASLPKCTSIQAFQVFSCYGFLFLLFSDPKQDFSN